MLDPSYLDAIKQSEGFAAQARWDYAQNTNGYGTRARYAGEVIDKAEADKRFNDEIKKAADFVQSFAPGLDDGSKAALTSLTYNAGTSWTASGLGQAVASGDLDKARSIFLQYNKAGGSVLDGLVQRRLQEVAWFGSGTSPLDASAGQPALDQQAFNTALNSGSPLETASNAGDATLLPASAPDGIAVSTRSGSTQMSEAPLAGVDGNMMLLTLLTYLNKNGMPENDASTRESESKVRSA